MKSSRASKEPKTFAMSPMSPLSRKIDTEDPLGEDEKVRPVSKPVKKLKKKEQVSMENIPEGSNKNTIVQTISSALENKGISKEMGKHQGVIHISEGYKKKIYMSRPSSDSDSSPTPVHCYFCRQSAGPTFIGNPIRMKGSKYMIEGCFCSFNCLLAYQQEQTSVKYRECGLLAHYLYRELFQQPMKMTSSKSWKLLQDYGGALTLRQWRGLCDSFTILTPEDYEKYKQLIVPSSELFIGD
jgi:hypothetical protein